MSRGARNKVVWTILVAAGKGSRFGGPKQLTEVGGRSLIDIALDVAMPLSDGVVLVVPQQNSTDMARSGCVVVSGGETRSDSVRAGLARVPIEADFVLVHDVARPMASRELFSRVIAALEDGEVAVVPVVPVVDSLKRLSDASGLVAVPREGIFAAQTPQGFSAAALRELHAAGLDTTDDSTAAEKIGIRVFGVAGETHNFKITTHADLAVANALWDVGVGGNT